MISLFAIITDKCNRSCEYCYHKVNISYNPVNISENLFRNCLISLAADENIRVLMTGGEPLTHPKFDELYRFTFSITKNVSIITNGDLLEKKIDDILKTGVPSIILSVSPQDSENKFKKISRIIEILNTRTIKCTLNCVITRKNITNISKIDHYISLRGIENIVLQPIFLDKNEFPKLREKLSLSEKSLANFTQKFDNLTKLGKIAGGYNYLNRIMKYYSEKKSKRDCRMGTSRIVLMSNGTLKRCFFNHSYPLFKKKGEAVERHNCTRYGEHCITLNYFA